ncbi:MAG TPA: ABC transporter ATP-binding protein [Bryobacteraceae bacterium]|nr:ABC transporter ATP-binding protein [Bryobacteraceae bacterium]
MKRAYRKLSPYLWRYRGGLGRGFAALVCKDLFAAAQPLMIGLAIDSLTRRFDLTALFMFAGGLVVLSAIKGVFQYHMRVILIGISRDVEYDLRNDFFAHLTTMSGDFFNRYRTGDIMARATNDLNAVRMMLGPGIMYWAETMLTMVLAVGVMLWVDWPLALMALAPAPVVSFVVMVFGKAIHQRFEKIQSMFSDISSRVQENLAGVRVVRAYAQEQHQIAQFETLNRAFIGENLKLARSQGMFMPTLQALVGLAFLCVLWAGGTRLLAGEISLGSFVMFNTYMGMLVWPMIALGWVVNLMQRGTASLARIADMMEESAGIAAPASPRALSRPRGAIELRNVVVEFGGREALAGVSLHIPAGTTVAIVGHTGSGKSTLVNLIPRLLDASSGTVLFDGHDVREYDPGALRAAIGFVPQETFLFSDTLAANIAFGVASATDEEIARAAEIAGLAPDVNGFPDGYKTMVGERGITLSGGQKQRTAIARAILRNPTVLILDDALSSVDTLTEERILNALQKIMSDRTTILISHRVSTVRNADRIFVIEEGRLAEEGTHGDLVARGGYYADLHHKQLLEEELEAI